MKLDYIEIGTSDFDTLVQETDGYGISIDPLKIYLDRLPNKKENIKLKVALSNYVGKIDVFYIHPDDIERYNLHSDFKGCNSVQNPHPSVVNFLKEKGLSHLYRREEVEVITWDKLVVDHNITHVKFLKIDTEGHDHIIVKNILNSKTNILPQKIRFETNSLTSPEDVRECISLLKRRGYRIVSNTNEDTVVELIGNYPTKIIFTSNSSQYLNFWHINSEICSKILKITPVLFHITDEDSDFIWDEYGLVKRIKTVTNNTQLEAQVARLFAGTFFDDEIIMTSDIDMLLFDRSFLLNKLTNHKYYDISIIGADAYDPDRPESPPLMIVNPRFGMCYLVAKGYIFNKIMGITKEDSFETFLNKNGFTHGWNSDEVVFSQNLMKTDIKMNLISRDVVSSFYVKDRIEKFWFSYKGDGYHYLDLNELKSLDGFVEVHCPNFFEYKETIYHLKRLMLDR